MNRDDSPAFGNVYRLGVSVRRSEVLVGYGRVSTLDQNLDLQRDAFKQAGCKKVYEEKASGASSERVELSKALEALREGDTLVVRKLDRLGRSLPQLVQTVRALEERGVGFRSLRENLDTTSLSGKLVFHIFAALAEFERDIIRERTQVGLAAARARGRTEGRPKGRDKAKQDAAIALSLDKTRSVTGICWMLGISRASYYRYTAKS
jgi:DNA invertase Pin-like site-specific DNA recombinase